MSIYTYCLECW